MKKIILILVSVILLIGCQQDKTIAESNKEPCKEITTYKEVIKDSKVEIDGICYDIKSVTKSTFTYDNNGNLIEKGITNDDDELRIEYLYENNQLIEDRSYTNDQLSYTSYYYYEDDQLIKKRTIFKSNLEVILECSYGDHVKTQTNFRSNGEISFIATAYLDDDDKILKVINTKPDGEVMTSSTFYYENDQLKKVIRKSDGVYNTTFSYEYNNIGDKIMEYDIIHGEVNTLVAMFYDYEYYETLLPKTLTVYRIQAPIAEENIRDY
jgi:antitoxin component YwqK of YwqJK toxin-antitoxin module